MIFFLDENTEMLQIADFLVRGFFELFRSKNNKQKLVIPQAGMEQNSAARSHRLEEAEVLLMRKIQQHRYRNEVTMHISNIYQAY